MDSDDSSPSVELSDLLGPSSVSRPLMLLLSDLVSLVQRAVDNMVFSFLLCISKISEKMMNDTVNAS